jgi:hypothetical protein
MHECIVYFIYEFVSWDSIEGLTQYPDLLWQFWVLIRNELTQFNINNLLYDISEIFVPSELFASISTRSQHDNCAYRTKQNEYNYL